MVNISSKLKQYIGNFGQPSDVILTLRGVSGELKVYGGDIVQGSLSIDRRSVSGDKLEIGSAISSELKVSLYNEDGRFNNYTFEGASVFVQLKYTFDDNTVEYVPMGNFTVDERPRKLSSIQLKALDRMMYFAKPYDTELGYPASMYVILNDACSKCGVTSGVIPSDLVNSDFVVEKKPAADGLTYWSVIQMIAELNGVCAWTDENGRLKMGWYKSTDIKITPACRYSSDLQEQDITVTGVATTICEQQYIYGEEGYCFDLKGNLLIQVDVPEDGFAPDMSKVTPMLQKLATKVKGFKYRPYSCETMSLPHVWQMDALTYTDSDGNSFQSIVTNNTWTASRSKLAGKGKTAVLNGYASHPPFTPHQQAILDSVKRYTDRKVSNMEQGRLDLNEAIANSMGLYQTAEKQPDNSVKVYRHNKPLLEESDIIYTMTENGFAWTKSGWNGGKPVWHYGVDKDGNAILNAINTYKLVADLIVAGRLQSKDGASFFDLDTGIAQFLGEFTAKSQSYDPSLDVSATLRGFKVDSSNPDENEGTPAGLYFEDTNSNIFAHLIGVLLGKWKILQLGVNNEEGDTASMIQLTSSGVATVQDSSGSGQIFHTGNLLIESGIADMTGHFWQGNGGWDGMITVYPKSGKLFTSNAVPVVSVNTSWAHAFQAGCKRPSFDGSFEIWCHASNVYSSAPAVSVSWLLTEVKA